MLEMVLLVREIEWNWKMFSASSVVGSRAGRGLRREKFPSEGNFNYVTFVLFSIHGNNEARMGRKREIYLTHKFGWWYKHRTRKNFTRKLKFLIEFTFEGSRGGGALKAVKQSQRTNTSDCDVMAENFPENVKSEKPDLSIPIPLAPFPPISSSSHTHDPRKQCLVRGFCYWDKLEGCDCSTKMILNWWKQLFPTESCAEISPPTLHFFSLQLFLPAVWTSLSFLHSKIEIEFPSKWILSIAMKIWAI